MNAHLKPVGKWPDSADLGNSVTSYGAVRVWVYAATVYRSLVISLVLNWLDFINASLGAFRQFCWSLTAAAGSIFLRSDQMTWHRFLINYSGLWRLIISYQVQGSDTGFPPGTRHCSIFVSYCVGFLKFNTDVSSYLQLFILWSWRVTFGDQSFRFFEQEPMRTRCQFHNLYGSHI